MKCPPTRAAATHHSTLRTERTRHSSVNGGAEQVSSCTSFVVLHECATVRTALLVCIKREKLKRLILQDRQQNKKGAFVWHVASCAYLDTCALVGFSSGFLFVAAVVGNRVCVCVLLVFAQRLYKNANVWRGGEASRQCNSRLGGPLMGGEGKTTLPAACASPRQSRKGMVFPSFVYTCCPRPLHARLFDPVPATTRTRGGRCRRTPARR